MIIEQRSRLGRSVVSLLLACQAFLWQTALAAQEIRVEIEGDERAWYANWWVWVLIALFVIIIVALTSRGRTKAD